MVKVNDEGEDAVCREDVLPIGPVTWSDVMRWNCRGVPGTVTMVRQVQPCIVRQRRVTPVWKGGGSSMCLYMQLARI
jgi:hypothetical protein